MKERIVIVAVLAALWTAWPAAASAPVVSLGNGILEVPVGQTAPLPVSVADVQDLYGVEIHLRFDPAVVQVADADSSAPGVQIALGDFLSADFVAQNRADNQAGTIDFAVTQLNPSEAKSGSGTLLTIGFQGIGAGQASRLEVLDKVLTTRDGEVIPATVASAEIRVQGAAATAGTALPSPTPAPPKARPSASVTPASPAQGDAPTATRAFTTTPEPAAPAAGPSVLPSATSDQTSIGSAATQTGTPVVATATTSPQTSATEAPAPPGTDAVAPSPAPLQTPLSGPTAGPIQPTPALVAKSSGDRGEAILGPGSLEKPGASGQQHNGPKRPALTGLLIVAVAILGLAAVLATVMLRLFIRRRRA
jgi:hypothetical protein